MSKLFGFKLPDTGKTSAKKAVVSPVPSNEEDKSDFYISSASDKLKDIIRKEFKHIKSLIGFDKKCHEIFRTWYIDGRVYYHKVIDLKNPQEGIQEVRYIDPLKIRLIRKQEKLAI